MIEVLIVDDYEVWRRTVRQLLMKLPELQVICEVADGLEAVQKAAQLKPALILMDIGLPKLNGIEATRQIRKLSPASEIIFLSQDNLLNPNELASTTGSRGYVLKADVGNDLLPAIEAVARGERFVSRSLRRFDIPDIPATKGSPPPTGASRLGTEFFPADVPSQDSRIPRVEANSRVPGSD